MSKKLWTDVDRYLIEALLPADEALDAALAASDGAGLPAINVSPPQGKLLHLLARIRGARSILEIGTLGGYSTIWLARALPPGGRVVTLEIDPKCAEVARKNLARAGLTSSVDIRLGPALETLPKLVAEKAEPFDFVFIDADKTNNARYFEWALKLTRSGSLIVVDNIVRNGAVLNAESNDESSRGSREVIERVGNEPRVDATAIQTVCGKGYDGFILAVVK